MVLVSARLMFGLPRPVRTAARSVAIALGLNSAFFARRASSVRRSRPRPRACAPGAASDVAARRGIGLEHLPVDRSSRSQRRRRRSPPPPSARRAAKTWPSPNGQRLKSAGVAGVRIAARLPLGVQIHGPIDGHPAPAGDDDARLEGGMGKSRQHLRDEIAAPAALEKLLEQKRQEGGLRRVGSSAECSWCEGRAGRRRCRSSRRGTAAHTAPPGGSGAA